MLHIKIVDSGFCDNYSTDVYFVTCSRTEHQCVRGTDKSKQRIKVKRGPF